MRPFGASDGPVGLRTYAVDTRVTPAGAEPGQVVLGYQLQIGFDPAGRTGAVIVDTETKDRQLAVTMRPVPNPVAPASSRSTKRFWRR